MPTPTAPRRVPWAVKVLYTAFMAVLVPYYWSAYGPTNFLYFCDVALFLALAAVWTERPLLASMPAVGILLPQSLWMADFLGGLAGRPVTGMTAYMFNPELPPFTRGLSLFHFWLPLLLLGLVARLGYDRRALAAWTVLAWVLLLVCYFLMPAPPRPADAPPGLPVNINYVHGPGDDRPQDWLPPLLYLAGLMVGLPVCVFLPTHLLLRLAFGRAREPGPCGRAVPVVACETRRAYVALAARVADAGSPRSAGQSGRAWRVVVRRRVGDGGGATGDPGAAARGAVRSNRHRG